MSNLVADVNDLKSRLEWGQPALTIVDVRDRHTYNHGHITGAISIPLNDLGVRLTSLHKQRHIYVYGENEDHAAQAAYVLGSAGFKDVFTIQGGLSAWKTVGGAVEGV
jgi:rhodanese-related sulfurtransferase